jgi:hypothetical protein
MKKTSLAEVSKTKTKTTATEAEAEASTSTMKTGGEKTNHPSSILHPCLMCLGSNNNINHDAGEIEREMRWGIVTGENGKVEFVAGIPLESWKRCKEAMIKIGLPEQTRDFEDAFFAGDVRRRAIAEKKEQQEKEKEKEKKNNEWVWALPEKGVTCVRKSTLSQHTFRAFQRNQDVRIAVNFEERCEAPDKKIVPYRVKLARRWSFWCEPDRIRIDLTVSNFSGQPIVCEVEWEWIPQKLKSFNVELCAQKLFRWYEYLRDIIDPQPITLKSPFDQEYVIARKLSSVSTSISTSTSPKETLTQQQKQIECEWESTILIPVTRYPLVFNK